MLPQHPPHPPPGLAPSVAARARIVKETRSPLGFCVLALLIVEAFLVGAGTLFALPDVWKIIALGVGVLLFLVVFATVVWLVVKYPQNLVFSEESHVQYAAMQLYGTESKALTSNALLGLSSTTAPSEDSRQLSDNSGGA
jgi:hypothetical protein